MTNAQNDWQEIRQLLKELTKSQQKTDAQLEKTGKKLDKLAKMYGGLGNNIGEQEEFFYRGLRRKPQLLGIELLRNK